MAGIFKLHTTWIGVPSDHAFRPLTLVIHLSLTNIYFRFTGNIIGMPSLVFICLNMLEIITSGGF